MISVVIEAGQDDEALARTLTALVGAAAEGVVRDVVVVTSSSPLPAIGTVVDAFGCQAMLGGVSAAITAARGPWVLILPVGSELEPAWWRDAVHFIDRSDRLPASSAVATFTPVIGETGLAARWREWRLRLDRRRGAGGLLGRKDTLAQAVRPRLIRLRTRIDRTASP